MQENDRVKTYRAGDGERYTFRSEASKALGVTDAQLPKLVNIITDSQIIRDVLAQDPHRKGRPPTGLVRAKDVERLLENGAERRADQPGIEAELGRLTDLVATLRTTRGLSAEYEALLLRRLDLATELVTLGLASERLLLQTITQLEVPGVSEILENS